ncbi:hypothetical protein BGX24_011925 [Mortierella sp. AD032]|nr:hypothetical protein BGX24_011925 [Mortierella sp. AD032]
MEPMEDKPSVAQLRSLLNRTTRIKITDGRMFVGQFMCIDHSKNIILSAAYEYRTTTKCSPDSTKNASDSLGDYGAGEEDTPLEILSTDTPQDATPNVLAAAKRFVGLVMIPGHHIVKAEMDCSHLRGADSRIKAPAKIYGLDYLRGLTGI